MNIQRSVNPATGNPQLRMEGELVSVGNTTQTNVNGTAYRVAIVKLVLKGQVKQKSGIIYEEQVKYGNANGTLVPGTKLLCVLEKTPGQKDPLLLVTPLAAGERVSADEIDWNAGSFVEPSEKQKEAAAAYHARSQSVQESVPAAR